MRMELTRDLAYAAAMDAGDRSMRAAGRTAWSAEDTARCREEFNCLWPLEKDTEPQEGGGAGYVVQSTAT